MVVCIAEWHLEARLDEARRVREEISEALCDYEEAHINAFQLACAELIVNLSRYPDPKPTNVILTLSCDGQYLWLELKDNGPSFNNFSQQIRDPESLTAAEHGMGLKVLAQTFTDIRYVPACYREDAYNLMLLRMSLQADSFKPLSVLVVDDDPTYRAIINAYLDERYEVIEAECVSAAFEKALKYHPDIVICDIQMPNQDGTALFDQLSHIPDVADVAFVYISGCDNEEQISKAISRPIDEFLSKPIEKTRLINTLERAIQRRGYLKEQIKLEIDQKVTLGLKPELPDEIPGFRVQVRSLNPEAGGGDLVQLQERGAQNLLIMADLMGHGLTPKGYVYALAGYLRGLFSAASSDSFNLPNLFSTLSKCFNEDRVLKETLATLIALRFSEDGEMEWVNAGQPYPLVITKGRVSPLKVDGPLPGLGLSDYQPLRHSLKSGERVLIFSDGFCDAAEVIPDSLIQVIETSREMPLSSAADAILGGRLKDNTLEDDLTMVLLEKL